MTDIRMAMYFSSMDTVSSTEQGVTESKPTRDQTLLEKGSKALLFNTGSDINSGNMLLCLTETDDELVAMNGYRQAEWWSVYRGKVSSGSGLFSITELVPISDEDFDKAMKTISHPSYDGSGEQLDFLMGPYRKCLADQADELNGRKLYRCTQCESSNVDLNCVEMRTYTATGSWEYSESDDKTLLEHSGPDTDFTVSVTAVCRDCSHSEIVPNDMLRISSSS